MNKIRLVRVEDINKIGAEVKKATDGLKRQGDCWELPIIELCEEDIAKAYQKVLAIPDAGSSFDEVRACVEVAAADRSGVIQHRLTKAIMKLLKGEGREAL